MQTFFAANQNSERKNERNRKIEERVESVSTERKSNEGNKMSSPVDLQGLVLQRKVFLSQLPTEQLGVGEKVEVLGTQSEETKRDEISSDEIARERELET